MKKKYPIIKYSDELWEEIEPILRNWDCPFGESAAKTYIVSNYGNPEDDQLLIGMTHNDSTDDYRYLVKTKEEFLSAIAKLLGKTYSQQPTTKTSEQSVITLSKQNKIKLNFKL